MGIRVTGRTRRFFGELRHHEEFENAVSENPDNVISWLVSFALENSELPSSDSALICPRGTNK